MSTRDISKDLETELLRDMQELLNRRLTVAAVVLDVAEIVIIAHNVSVSMFMGAQVLALANAKDPADEQLLLTMEQGLLDRARQNRAQIARTAAALRRGEKPEQAL